MLATAPPPTSGYIRSPRFDTILVWGCALVAIFSGLAVSADPMLFGPILFADIWLLGSQHVIATYTRLCCDKQSYQENKFLVLGLPWIVFGALALAFLLSKGTAIVTTIYLYWQWFHYTRQSYGVHRIYARKGTPLGSLDDKLTAWVLYAVPLWGILSRSHHKMLFPDEKFLSSDYWGIPVPEWTVTASALAAVALGLTWLIRQVGLFVEGKLSIPHASYVISHCAVFIVGYNYIADITYGWLVLNVWHNAQYILIVWMYNNNRFKKGIDPAAKLLSYISQRKFIWLYFTVCLAATGIFYGSLYALKSYILLPFIPAGASWAVVTYQAVNFHHYLVDGIIWKVRKQQNQQRFGIETPPAPKSTSLDDALEAVV